jgi:hypothetical protein
MRRQVITGGEEIRRQELAGLDSVDAAEIATMGR